MFVDELLSQGATPTLERLLRFTEARQTLLTEDVANVSTPDYRQKDLSVEAFQKVLRERLSRPSADPAEDRLAMDAAVEHPRQGILSHDGNNRSMEQLMSDSAKNAMTHNLVVELLRRQYQTMDMALKERVG